MRLTGRGTALLVLGIGVSVAAGMIGQRDLIWVGLFVVALPLLAAAYLLFVRPRVAHSREVTPDTIAVGTTARVILRISNDSPGQASALRFVDAASPWLGGGAGFVVARGFGRWEQTVGYTVPSERRGHFPIGPLWGQASDPFGLVTRSVLSQGDASMLRVTPRIWQLSELAGGAGLGSAGEATPQRIGQAGADDVLVREHRYGDDMRRVHWKMSAKKGDLMVRLEEHPWDPSSTIIVDTRLNAHRGGDGPDGSLEWAVSAAASVAALLTDGGHRVAVLAPSGPVFQPGHGGAEASKRLMIGAMTDLTASEHSWLGAALDDPESLSTAASLIAVTGHLTARDAAALIAASGRARSLVALVPRAAAWGQKSQDHDDAVRMLRNRGWKVESYGRGESVPQVWERLSR